jgi:hypothetical protein
MVNRKILIHFLLATMAQLTIQNVLPTDSTTTLLSAQTTTIIALPAVTTKSNSVDPNCNIQGSVNASRFNLGHGGAIYSTPLACEYDCDIITSCIMWSWNTSSAALTTGNCGHWPTDATSIIPGNTGVFFYYKGSGCVGVQTPTYNASVPFEPEPGVFLNTAVDDCGIEGTADTEWTREAAYRFQYDSVLTCQMECDTEDACISYSYDYGAGNGTCIMSYKWLAERVTRGETGVWYSDGSRKTGYKCFDSKPFGT